MTSSDTFGFDFARHTSGATLRSEHQAEFQRLIKTLRYGTKSQLLVLDTANQAYRDQIIKLINDFLLAGDRRAGILQLSETQFPDFTTLESTLRDQIATVQAFHLIDDGHWFTKERWGAFNLRREAIVKSLPVPIFLWLDSSAIGEMARAARDLWSWRSGVFDFSPPLEPTRDAIQTRQSSPIDPRSLSERTRRIAEIRTYREANPDLPEPLKLQLLDEMADLHYSLGQLDEALRIRQDEELPVYEKLGDIRARAITLGKIADIWQARGQLDEALRIRQDEELPVYEKLGDIHARAITQAKLALGLLEKDHRDRAEILLKSALSDLIRLKLPEAETVRAFIRDNGFFLE